MITHVCFIALTLARSLGRCLKTRPKGLVFKQLHRDQQVLMHEKTCVIPIFYGDLVKKFKRIVGKPNFSDQFKKILKR